MRTRGSSVTSEQGKADEFLWYGTEEAGKKMGLRGGGGLGKVVGSLVTIQLCGSVLGGGTKNAE